MSKSPDYLNNLFSYGVQALQANDLNLAEKTFQQILREFPNHPDALHFSGLIHTKRGDQAKAVDLITQAIRINSKNPTYFVNLGRIHAQSGDLIQAIDLYHQAIKVNPQFAEAYFNLGNAQKNQNKYQEAISSYTQSIQIQPGHFQAIYNLGNCHLELGNYKTAIQYYESCVKVNPNFPPAHNNLGVVLEEWDRWDEAEKNYKKAIELDPQYLEGHDNLGSFYSKQGNVVLAKQEYKLAASITKNEPWSIFKAELVGPFIPQTNAEIDNYRSQVDQMLDYYLSKDLAGDINYFNKLGIEPPASFPYQGRNDKVIKQKFAKLFSRYVPNLGESAHAGNGKIGFVVTKGHEGVFLKCMKGMIMHLADQFDICIVCSFPNGEKILRPELQHPKLNFVSITDKPIQVAEALRKMEFSVLYYWEVGTDAINYFLPHFRIAPIQCTSWGWPVTSGIGNMDYFLSSQGLESGNNVLLSPELVERSKHDSPSNLPPRHSKGDTQIVGSDHYTEQLVLFNRLPVYYHKPNFNLKQLSRNHFSLKEKDTLYLCAQNLKKVHPDFDNLALGILETDPNALILFIEDKRSSITDLLRKRLNASLGPHSHRLRFLDRMERDEFLSLHQIVDVVLDTIYYTGGANSCYDAFAMGTPIITLPFDYHRSRYTTSAYQQMGITDLIALNEKVYIQKAVAVANDKSKHEELKSAILDQNHQVFEDKLAVEEFSAWLNPLLGGVGVG